MANSPASSAKIREWVDALVSDDPRERESLIRMMTEIHSAEFDPATEPLVTFQVSKLRPEKQESNE